MKYIIGHAAAQYEAILKKAQNDGAEYVDLGEVVDYYEKIDSQRKVQRSHHLFQIEKRSMEMFYAM